MCQIVLLYTIIILSLFVRTSNIDYYIRQLSYTNETHVNLV